MQISLRWLLLASVVLMFAAGCAKDGRNSSDSSAMTMDQIAEQYVQLVLRVGKHDADYVDAYYGPAEWKKMVDAEQPRPLAELGSEAQRLITAVEKLDHDKMEPIGHLRSEYLHKQLKALQTRVEMLGGKKLSFDEESRALYDAVAPTRSEDFYKSTRDQLDKLLPAGKGSLSERYERYRKGFVIPKAKLNTVFRRAIEECKTRTAKHITLPTDETFKLEFVQDKPWSGYNWYQGNFNSLIQINDSLPIYIDRAVDLACHEGYPGHHVYNMLLEKNLVRDRKWVEFSVYPLYSPQSLIAEGSANYGIDIAFPGKERVYFEKKTLFPLAGINPAGADKYYQALELYNQLSYAGNEAARKYLNGEIAAAAAAKWLVDYALYSPERAAQRVKFMDKYRSYVINYNLGKDLVRQHVEAKAGTDEKKRWEEFHKLLSSPRLPSRLSK